MSLRRALPRGARVTGVRLPEGRHFALTWSIPDTFGGMTDALLRRSAAFHRLDGVTVDVLTFDARTDTPEIELELRRRGVLVDGVRVTNLYDWLRRHPLPGGSLQLDRDVFTPIDASTPDEADGIEIHGRGAHIMSRSRVDAEGRTLQLDHYRDDGTLLLSDRRDTRVRGVLGGRSVVLCDAEGRPVRSWRGIRPLYRAWIDALTGGRPSFLIIDSKTVAPLLLGYRRPHIVTAHVVHASHRSADSEQHPIRRSRREVFEQLDGFDLVVLLSRRQRDDVERLVGRHDHLTVIPNARPLPQRPATAPGPGPRERDRGVVLAALTRRKRVSHAIDAVQRANAAFFATGPAAGRPAGPAGPPVRLDVYGDGESRPALERRITDPAAVRLHGFDPGARRQLLEASFLLLTSHSEGFPLVLVESMAAGCLPIAYDIPYGPADLIRDGRNGFLVPAGDVDALAAAIVRLQRMSPQRVARMRAHAVRTAARFDERRVTQLWAGAFEQAVVRRAAHGSERFRGIRSLTAKLPLPRPVRALGARLVVGADRVFRAPGRVG